LERAAARHARRPTDKPEQLGKPRPRYQALAALERARTKEQVATQTKLCLYNTPTYDAASCHAFEVDDANQACLKCMYSSVGAEPAAPVMVTGANAWIPNTGGCIALLQGDSSETSCGARRQAADLCFSAVCESACAATGYNGYSACIQQASATCKRYVDPAACSLLPQYARCTSYTSFADAVAAVTDVFCVSGPPAGSETGDGGAAGAVP
jgi:hypothetical protein